MQIRDRIKELRRVKGTDLRPNPRNWRGHPARQQDALRGVLAEVGYADAVLARELPDGTLMLIDGHLRAETTPDALVPVLVLDVDEQEADKILLTHDSLAGMATIAEEPLRRLLANADFADEAVCELMEKLAKDAVREAQRVPTADRPEVRIREVFQVIVECHDEAEQRALYERIRGEGYRCRVLML
jgi:hypothetical protein